jgi:hypothetical protein
MRRVAPVKAPEADALWVIVHDTDDGVYLFACASNFDGSATGDSWFETLSDAYAACAEVYGVHEADWVSVGDPWPGCQQDWISPVRVPGRESGSPRWGELERWVDGAWVAITSAHPRPTIEEAIRQADATAGPRLIG